VIDVEAEGAGYLVVADALQAVTPRIRGIVSRRVGLRTTPELRFIADPVAEQAQRVDELLRRIEPGSDTETPVDPTLYKAPRDEA
jgi:ribosome-binding factor A